MSIFLAGWAFIIWSALKLGYPVIGTAGGCEEWGFLATTILEIGVAVGFLLMYFEHSHAELAQHSDQLRCIMQNMPVMLDAFDDNKRAEAERLSLEERLRQAQKMEAIGTLAGGIAHDFNNILAAVIGFGELAKLESDGSPEVTASIDEILKASFRARDLVRQILTFNRQTESEFNPIQPHLIVKETVKLLRASLPSTIHVNQDTASQATIMGDPTQIHQGAMNLCTNAYHAMRGTGGHLDVSLVETSIEKSTQPELRGLE